jgi:hypothetical protein
VLGQDRLQGRLLERVAVVLVHERFVVGAHQIVDVLPLVGALGHIVVGVLHPHHRHSLGTGPVDQRVEVRDDTRRT